MLIDVKIKISMDGKGVWCDNWMIEWLWRLLKYECVYLNVFEIGFEMCVGIGKWLIYYNVECLYLMYGILIFNEVYESRIELMRLVV